MTATQVLPLKNCSVPSAGRVVICTLSVLLSISATPNSAQLSKRAVSSTPLIALELAVGASLTGVMSMSTLRADDAVLPLGSVLVAVKVRLLLPLKLAAPRYCKVAKFQAAMLTLVLPAVAVKLLTPSVRVAPTGSPDADKAKVSEPSVSGRATLSVPRLMKLSSGPLRRAGK